QGDDLHPARVRLQAQLLRLVVGAGAGDRARQPVEQAVQAERGALRLLQVFGQLQVVGEAAFAVGQAEQAPRGLRAQFADQGQRTAALQAFAPAQRLELPALQGLAPGERGDRVRV